MNDHLKKDIMKTTFLIVCLFCCLPVYSQTYTMADSHISFYSSAPVEDIEAISTESRSLFDAKTGNIAFVIPISSFEFEKKLMQEHFNEKFMESHQYPEATFTGILSGYEPERKGMQQAKAVGRIMIHGVSRPLETEGSLEFSGEEVLIEATFPLRVEDFDIKIPKLLFYNIAEEVEVRVKGRFEPHGN